LQRQEKDVKGGWQIIRGEKRFVPLSTKRLAHCKSCLYFRKSGYCALNPDTFTHAEAEACENYVNRTYKSDYYEVEGKSWKYDEGEG
jgi:hypothetical protein